MDRSNASEALLGLAGRVGEQAEPEWDLASTGDLQLDATRDRLHDIARIARAYRRSAQDYERPLGADEPTGATDTADAPMGHWGHLELLEEIGGGSYGRVFRARDPKLDREVALKLLDVGHDELAARRALEEGRHLARIRHENVLAVHGADVRDGEVGIWAELVRGEDLEARLQRGERLGADELRAVGRTLCGALAALHREGLVHADLKAANVMRDRDGRLLLVDLGSSLLEHGGEKAVTSTPLASAPELLEGGSPTPSSDLWSLAALLYRLASGEYPAPAASMSQLRAAHRENALVPLRDRRPDLPASLLEAIDHGLSADPEARPASAGAFERALSSAPASDARRDEPAPTSDRGSQLWRWAAAAVLLLAIGGAALWSLRGDGPTGPVAFESTLQRSRPEGIVPITSGAEIRVGDQLYLELDLQRESWVYVLNEDDTGALTVLFPLQGLDGVNPLPEGHHRLPGSESGQAQDWQVTSAGAEERIAVVVSTRPLVPLERRLSATPRASAAEIPQYAQLDLQSVEGLRGVAGLAPSRLDPAMRDEGVLEEIVAGLRSEPDASLRVELYQLSGQ